MTTPFAARVEPGPDVMFRTVGDESVLLHLKSEAYLGLDAIGTRMWTLLTASESIQSAFDALLHEYEVDSQQLRRDLEDFVHKLVEHDLVRVHAGENAARRAE
jgi:hypothetical protein